MKEIKESIIFFIVYMLLIICIIVIHSVYAEAQVGLTRKQIHQSDSIFKFCYESENYMLCKYNEDTQIFFNFTKDICVYVTIFTKQSGILPEILGIFKSPLDYKCELSSFKSLNVYKLKKE